jgi:hypothetical protein
MKIVECPEGSALVSLTDKVMGVFERGEDVSRFASSLDAVESGEVIVLTGAEGEACLQNLKKSVEGFLDALLGDLESSMLKVYLQAVERGATVFAVPATAENRDQIVDAAIDQGARHVAHFGQAVNESFENRTGDMPP